MARDCPAWGVPGSRKGKRNQAMEYSDSSEDEDSPPKESRKEVEAKRLNTIIRHLTTDERMVLADKLIMEEEEEEQRPKKKRKARTTYLVEKADDEDEEDSDYEF